jgi:hypothetical protein
VSLSSHRWKTPAVLALLAAVLSGCGSGGSQTATPTSATASGESDPYVAEPFSHQQKLVVRGAKLAVSDGCAVCHLMSSSPRLGPSFVTFAGHHVTLRGDHRVLVDEHFVREGLLHPTEAELRGYDPEPMIRALAPLKLAEHPAEVAALAAFVEEIGPEPAG